MTDRSLPQSTLEFQIQDARNKAELFSKSLQEAREHESIALKTLEEERKRWTHSFEEKSVMVDQLERELTNVVDALEKERTIPKSTSFDIANSSIDEINAHFHKSIENGRLTTSELNHGSSEFHKCINNNTTTNIKRKLTYNGTKKEKGDDMIWSDLLTQYQDQLKRVTMELEKTKHEKNEFSYQISLLNDQLRHANRDTEQFSKAIKDAEGKLQFRINQVLELEQEKHRLKKNETVLYEQVERLESNVKTLTSELNATNQDLRLHVTRANKLEMKLNEIVSSETRVRVTTETVEALEFSLSELRQQLSDNNRQHQKEVKKLERQNDHLQQQLTETIHQLQEEKSRAPARAKTPPKSPSIRLGRKSSRGAVDDIISAMSPSPSRTPSPEKRKTSSTSPSPSRLSKSKSTSNLESPTRRNSGITGHRVSYSTEEPIQHPAESYPPKSPRTSKSPKRVDSWARLSNSPTRSSEAKRVNSVPLVTKTETSYGYTSNRQNDIINSYEEFLTGRSNEFLKNAEITRETRNNNTNTPYNHVDSNNKTNGLHVSNLDDPLNYSSSASDKPNDPRITISASQSGSILKGIAVDEEGPTSDPAISGRKFFPEDSSAPIPIEPGTPYSALTGMSSFLQPPQASEQWNHYSPPFPPQPEKATSPQGNIERKSSKSPKRAASPQVLKKKDTGTSPLKSPSRSPLRASTGSPGRFSVTSMGSATSKKSTGSTGSSPGRNSSTFSPTKPKVKAYTYQYSPPRVEKGPPRASTPPPSVAVVKNHPAFRTGLAGKPRSASTPKLRPGSSGRGLVRQGEESDKYSFLHPKGKIILHGEVKAMEHGTSFSLGQEKTHKVHKPPVVIKKGSFTLHTASSVGFMRSPASKPSPTAATMAKASKGSPVMGRGKSSGSSSGLGSSGRLKSAKSVGSAGSGRSTPVSAKKKSSEKTAIKNSRSNTAPRERKLINIVIPGSGLISRASDKDEGNGNISNDDSYDEYGIKMVKTC